MKVRPLAAVIGIGVFLYWVVQDPVGAAAVIERLFTMFLDLIQLLAQQIVRFLNALL